MQKKRDTNQSRCLLQWILFWIEIIKVIFSLTNSLILLHVLIIAPQILWRMQWTVYHKSVQKLPITLKQEMPFPDVNTALWTLPLCHCHKHWMFTVQRKALQWPFMSTQTLLLLLLLLLIFHLSLPVFEVCTDLVLHLTPQWAYSWKQRERRSREVKKKGRNRDSERKMR